MNFISLQASAWPQANTGAQVFGNNFIQPTGMSAGCFDHQDLVSDGLEICAEVHAAFDCHNSLL